MFASLLRDGVKKDGRAIAIEQDEMDRIRKDINDELRIREDALFEGLESVLLDQTASGGPKGVKSGTTLTKEVLNEMNKTLWFDITVKEEETQKRIEFAKERYQALHKEQQERLEELREKLLQGDDLAPSVLKVVKVYLAVKRRIQPGDKMAGRHGNKGVISTIIPVEDMPHLEDGRPVDIVLNPLGVPSRMNIGQILETHLGWAAKGLGEKIGHMMKQQASKDQVRDYLRQIYNTAPGARFDVDALDDKALMKLAKNLSDGVPMATPVFDGASETRIKELFSLG